MVKVAHRADRIGKCMVDERGNIRVKKVRGVYLNHQITPKRSQFLKDVVKVAHRADRIGKYMVDERGNIRVKKVRGGKDDKGDQFRYFTVINKAEKKPSN